MRILIFTFHRFIDFIFILYGILMNSSRILCQYHANHKLTLIQQHTWTNIISINTNKHKFKKIYIQMSVYDSVLYIHALVNSTLMQIITFTSKRRQIERKLYDWIIFGFWFIRICAALIKTTNTFKWINHGSVCFFPILFICFQKNITKNKKRQPQSYYWVFCYRKETFSIE